MLGLRQFDMPCLLKPMGGLPCAFLRELLEREEGWFEGRRRAQEGREREAKTRMEGRPWSGWKIN